MNKSQILNLVTKIKNSLDNRYTKIEEFNTKVQNYLDTNGVSITIPTQQDIENEIGVIEEPTLLTEG